MKFPATLLIFLGTTCAALAQQSPEFAVLDTAYKRLQEKNYEPAIAAFREAARLAPTRPDIQKDLAYALVKVGESAAARDAFAQAMRLDPDDTQVALEFAFLANDTGMIRQARRVFAQLRKTNETAATAYTNIDKPLADGITRWQAVIAQDPANFSAHEELARLAATRDETALAQREYETAWRLRPDRRDLLIDLGRLFQEDGVPDQAMTVLLAASHSPDPRTAERARNLMPTRYPYVYEFRNAIAFDPTNTDLRRELGYLLIAMGDQPAGERELNAIEPSLQDRANPPSTDARALGIRSYEAGYMPDAIRYLNSTLEDDPFDFEAMLKLAWAYNLVHQDDKAIPWFALASKSPNPAIANEASDAWRHLTPEKQSTSTSLWVFPMFSTRWHSAFGYAQWKTDLKLPFAHLRAYISTRLVGDSQGAIRQPGFANPQYLSESSIIPGIGITTNLWRGARLWGEAGVAWSYIEKAGVSRTQQDYRGGLSFVQSRGSLIGASSPGLFHEHELDAIYVHRFNKTFLLNLRNRIGVTIPTSIARVQFTWNFNASADPRRQYWANFLETGPGFRFRLPFMPPSMLITADALHGVYTVNAGNPRRPNYNDFRVGVWYSVSH